MEFELLCQSKLAGVDDVNSDDGVENLGKDGKLNWVCSLPSQGEFTLTLQYSAPSISLDFDVLVHTLISENIHIYSMDFLFLFYSICSWTDLERNGLTISKA